LGITLPPEPENTIENRMFNTSCQQVSGGRFDPTFQKVVVDFKSSKYSSVPLRTLTLINPLTKFKGLQDEDEVTFIPMENVSEDGAINTSLNRTVAGSKGYTTFAENDLLVAKITPCMENGKTGVARNLTNNYGYGSTEFHVFRPKSDEINIDFLHAFFHANFFRQNAKLTFGGSAGHQRVPPDFFQKLVLPIPPIPVQKEIVDEILSRQSQAQQLNQQAQREFAEAKQEIERLILG
jgi:restriction endonuclease S subunit